MGSYLETGIIIFSLIGNVLSFSFFNSRVEKKFLIVYTLIDIV